jgi:hypothetical protein
MKRISLLILAAALIASPLGAFAQVAVVAPVPDTCPCSDYHFTPITEKAKAVAAFWDARRKYHFASGLGTMAVLFTAMTHQPTQALVDAQNSFAQAQNELLQTRARASALGGLKVQGDGGADSPVVVTLKKGADYEMNYPR